jgi:hypothetical protein
MFPELTKEGDELIEQEIRDRFKRMCEGYYDSVCKKLVIEHKVCSSIRLTTPLAQHPIETPGTRQT